MTLSIENKLTWRTGFAAVIFAALQGCGSSSSDSTETPTPTATVDEYLPFAETKAVVEGVITALDDDDLDNMSPVAQIAAGKPSDILLWGQNLENTLNVTLGGKTCYPYDVGVKDEYDEFSDDMEVYVRCPSFAVGTQKLVVVDSGEKVYETDINVVTEATIAANRAAVAAKNRPMFSSVWGKAIPADPFAVGPKNAAVTATPGVVTGLLTGEAPTVSTVNGAHDYANLQKFNIRGVVVKLLDASNNDAEVATTVANGEGVYRFENVESGRNLKVKVLAQIAQTRASEATSGSQYNFMVRDNTSNGTEKTLYSLDSNAFTSSASGDVISINAPVGFDKTGVADDNARKSAPFAILDVIYNAARGISTANPNVTLPDVNIYWSPKNRPSSGNKNQGLISTSHYAGKDALPGVYILGKADVDTDEFDRGVIGHEFGHYLQDVASYTDSQGGSHADGNYKDASLAYGEGFGTAIGGLLSNSPYYIDTLNNKQSQGGVTNLDIATSGAGRTGFYAEGAIRHLMYKLGKTYGFTAFWNATTAMASGHDSATVFTFLAKFIQQPGVNEADVLKMAQSVNIKTLNLQGVLAAGVAADPEINETASGGAKDLEQLYVSLAPSAPADVAVEANLTATPASFCLNSKLPGAQLSNGLGSSKRFVFTSQHDGAIGVKLANSDGKLYPDQVSYSRVRDGSTGKTTPFYGWSGSGLGRFNVKKGVTYTLMVTVHDKSLLNMQNTCGLTLSLHNTAAIAVQ